MEISVSFFVFYFRKDDILWVLMSLKQQYPFAFRFGKSGTGKYVEHRDTEMTDLPLNTVC